MTDEFKIVIPARYGSSRFPGKPLADIHGKPMIQRVYEAAVDAGVRGAEKVGEVISSHVIARPHTNIDLVLPLGRSDEAKAELERFIELAPEDPLAFTSLSMVWVRKENFEKAEEAQEKARALFLKKEQGG